jgi:UDP-N-acetylmuramate--alanine ligase
VDAFGSNARLGSSEYLVAEADESDRSFLKLSPILSVVTNLDREHMDCYRDMDDVKQAFLEFINRVPFYGSCVVCADDGPLMALTAMARRRTFSYGTAPHADFRLRFVDAHSDARSCFEMTFDKLELGEFELHVPGKHNVLNAAAAVAIGTLLGIPQQQIAEGLRSFRGVDRRFQVKGTARGVTVVDDYGHHPTEIRATLAAARDCGYRRVHVLFQPHRYTRTRDLHDEFMVAFHDADTVTLLDIYAASEEPIPGVDSATLAEHIAREGVRYAPDFETGVTAVVGVAGDGDVIVTMGAGSVSVLAPKVLSALGSGD